MPNTPNKQDITPAEWWSEKADKDTKVNWQDGVDDYVDAKGCNAEAIKFSMDVVKELLPYIASVDRRWRKFPQSSFNISDYNAHKDLYHCIRNRLESLQNKAKKDREDEEKAAAEKLKAEAEEALEREQREAAERNRQLAANERSTKQAHIDAKSTDGHHRAKIVKTSGKIMDFNNTKQAIVVQNPDGGLRIDEQPTNLEELWQEYKDALQGVKRKKKAYEKARAAFKHLKTPEMSQDEQ